MSRIKNPTLRKRTKELSECAEDARECQLLGYELKDLGSLLVKMAIHMNDLQRKVDSQAEYIKTLNEDRKTENSSEKPNNCETCKFGEDKHRYAHICNECGVGINNYEPKTETQTETSTNEEKVQLTDCRNSEYYETCEYKDKCNPTVCFKALDELTDCAWKKGEE